MLVLVGLVVVCIAEVANESAHCWSLRSRRLCRAPHIRGDARQRRSRPEIRGNLVAAGAIAVPAERVRQVEKGIVWTS